MGTRANDYLHRQLTAECRRKSGKHVFLLIRALDPVDVKSLPTKGETDKTGLQSGFDSANIELEQLAC